MSAYDDERVEDAKTLGDVTRHRDEHPHAFTAGAQYALDTLLGRHPGVPVDEPYLDREAARILARVKREPL